MKRNSSRSSIALFFPLTLGIWLAFADHDDPPPEPFPADFAAKDLAYRAFDLVEHQIRSATTQNGTGWASQPGAIRTFTEDGELSRIYKLYSAPDPLAGSATQAIADLPEDWFDHPTRFVDLNKPIRGDGWLNFPIADPRLPRPEGFSYNDRITTNEEIPIEDGFVNAQRLPMPVQWIYLLQDGTHGYLDPEDQFVGDTNATVENPIVGRIAYWTDDNTAKININTASEGVFWDYPRTDTIEDRALANSQPAAGEYQRHPGHPATVCLSSVLFPNQRIGTPEGGTGKMDALPMESAELLWRIGNGVGTGGSSAGSVALEDLSTASASPSDYSPYSITGSFLDRPEVIGSHDTQQFRNRVERSKFFLTTESSASELNLHDYPRISVWPSNSQNTVLDPDFNGIASPGALRQNGQVISVNRRFQIARQYSKSRHAEFYNRHSGLNLDVFNYLKSMTARRLTGFGTSLAEKYGSGRASESEQILAMVFDHIRCTNLDEQRDAATPGAFGFSENGQVTSLCLCGGSATHRSRWDQPQFADPFAGGRLFTVSEVALVFYCTAWKDQSGNTGGENAEDLPPGTKRIAVGLAVELFCPAHGFAYLRPDIGMRLSGPIDGSDISPPAEMTINGTSLGTSTFAYLALNSDDNPTGTPGGHGGTELLLRNNAGIGISWDTGVVVPDTATTFSFGGNAEDLRLILTDTSKDTFLVNNSSQVLALEFPDAEIPVPPIPDTARSWAERLGEVHGNHDALIKETDAVRSLAVGHGDYRLIAGTRTPLAKVFQPHFDYNDSAVRQAHSLLRSNGSRANGASFEREMLPGTNVPESLLPDTPLSPSNSEFAPRVVGDYPFSMDPAVTGDFDNGFGNTRDGPYLNRTDDGTVLGSESGEPHYFDSTAESFTPLAARRLHAPHRIMPGPVMFGSIPSGVRAGVPWRTLLFRPDPQHYGASSTPDHLWLDLFRMPAPLPYRNGNSRRGDGDWKDDWFSSEGKINLNYQILPFAHINRATGIHAALKAEKMMAIPSTDGEVYKSPGGPTSYRHFIDAEETLGQWEDKFAAGDIFRSASEICEMYLVPEGRVLGEKSEGDYPAMRQFWEEHKLTGDNTKERPYAALYQHFTTRSNSYEIHVIAQKIRKSATGAPEVFDPESDLIGEEYRGIATLTRKIDPLDLTLPYVIGQADAPPLTDRYTYELSDVRQRFETPFKIDEITLDPNGIPTIKWQSQARETYRIQRSSELGEWIDLSGDIQATGEILSFTDETEPIQGSRIFYRVIKL